MASSTQRVETPKSPARRGVRPDESGAATYVVRRVGGGYGFVATEPLVASLSHRAGTQQSKVRPISLTVQASFPAPWQCSIARDAAGGPPSEADWT